MPPKTKFSKQQIIDVAFEIAKSEGIENITIRKVAKDLGSSIAPIYVNFNDVDELIGSVIQKVVELSQQILHEQDSGKPFRDIGMAGFRFAKEYPLLFKDFVMNSQSYMKDYDEGMGDELILHMQKDPDLEGFTEEELREILMKMKIFQTGLSIMVANRLFTEDVSDEWMVEILDSTASDVIVATRLRKKVKFD